MPRRLNVMVGVATLVAGGLLATATSAEAHNPTQRVWITVTGDGSHARISNDDVHPGWLTLYLRDATAPTLGAQIVVARMNPGYRVSRLVADIAQQLGNSTPAQAAASTRDINKIAVALGGGDTIGSQTFFTSDTIRLPRTGQYYIISTGAKNGPAVVGDLEARGRTVQTGVPNHSGDVTLGNGSADTITLTGLMPRDGTVRVTNSGDSVHLLAISSVADGVTDAQVQAEYDTLMAGGTPTSDPAGLLSQPAVSTGSDAISPGHSSLFSYDLPPGTYLLQCFVADDMTGVPHAFMGMHLVVHIS